MTDKSVGGTGDAVPRKMFAINQVFLRSASLDAPLVPQMNVGLASSDWDDVTFKVTSEAQHLVVTRYEVQLIVEVHGTQAGETVFRSVTEHRAVFLVRGYTDEEARALLRTEGAELVYPYAREVILSLAGRAGIQRLALPPRPFEPQPRGDA